VIGGTTATMGSSRQEKGALQVLVRVGNLQTAVRPEVLGRVFYDGAPQNTRFLAHFDANAQLTSHSLNIIIKTTTQSISIKNAA
jgi:hypothetical protein